MALPSNFSPAEHLQDVIRRTFNPEIKQYFRDVGAENWDETLDDDRAHLRVACTHRDDDSLVMTHLRLMVFQELRGLNSQAISGGSSSPSGTLTSRKYRPKILLYFLEDAKDVAPGFDPVAGEIGFRLMDETSTSLTKAELERYAHIIKANFASGNGFVWKKGKELYSYSDWDKGYQLQLLCRTEAEARRVVNQVLAIQGDNPQWKRFQAIINAAPSEAFPTIPETEIILGQRVKLPRKRPIADVRFQYATISLSGLPRAIPLVDRSGLLSNALLKN